MWLFNRNDVDYFFEKINILLEKATDEVKAASPRLVGEFETVDEIFHAVEDSPLETDYYGEAFFTLHKSSLDDDTYADLLSFLASTPAGIMPLYPGHESEFKEWLRAVEFYVTEQDEETKAYQHIVPEEFELDGDYDGCFDRNFEAYELTRWLEDPFEKAIASGEVALPDDLEEMEESEADDLYSAYDKWLKSSEIAKEIESLFYRKVKEKAKSFNDARRPMLTFSAFQYSREEAKSDADTVLYGVWQYCEVNPYFRGNFEIDDPDDLAIYDRYGFLAQFVDGKWEPLSKVTLWEVTIPPDIDDFILLDGCDAVTAAHLDMAKELIKRDYQSVCEFEPFNASLVWEYDNSDNTLTLLNCMTSCSDGLVAVEPHVFEDEVDEMDTFYGNDYRFLTSIDAYLVHVLGGRPTTNVVNPLAAFSRREVQPSDRKPLTESESIQQEQQLEFVRLLSERVPQGVQVFAYDPYRYSLA